MTATTFNKTHISGIGPSNTKLEPLMPIATHLVKEFHDGSLPLNIKIKQKFLNNGMEEFKSIMSCEKTQQRFDRAKLNQSMYRMGSKVDVKIMNVTFQSALANKNNTSTSVPNETKKQKPRKSKRLVVDRIVGGKIMRAEPND